MPDTISSAAARRLILNQQGLLTSKPRWGRGYKGAVKAVNDLGYVQLDAISVIERAHHHTLWSRVPGYQSKHLYAALEKQDLFEYWGHACAFLPMASYRYYLHRMERIRKQQRHWFQVDPKVKKWVLDRIRAEGPLYSRDFENHGHVSKGMWDGKPAKKALHELFMAGQVMVRARHQFQRQYDLPERVLPQTLDISIPDSQELGQYRVHRGIASLGLVTRGELIYLEADLGKVVDRALKALQESGEIIPVQIEGQGKQLYFTTPAQLEQSLRVAKKQLHLLSPFDNAVIQRKRLKNLFGFDYQTEIYLPPQKRKYGYFSQPILWGTRYLGRLDPKACRDERVLLVRNLALEPDIELTGELLESLASRLQEFATFNGCEQVRLEHTAPKGLRKDLEMLLGKPR
jgi:uncharacterized protein YcaQ